jgi:hypothetical protein
MMMGPDKSNSTAHSRIKWIGRKNKGGDSGANTWVVGSGGRERSVGHE